MEELNKQVLYELGPDLFELAMRSWNEGDILGVLIKMPPGQRMCFVADNWRLLKQIGKYEEALLVAYHTIGINFSHWSMDVLSFLFMQADIEKLRKAGDPIPDQATFTLYRGVNGKGRRRRVNGFSWTASPNTAAWFAKRFNLPDSTVYTVTVPNKSIMACIFDGHEDEYLLRLPLPIKPKRLKEMPEAFLP